MDITLDPTGLSAVASAFSTAISAITQAATVNRQTMSPQMRDLNDAMQVQIWLDWRHFLEVVHVVEPAMFDFKALLEATKKQS